MAVFSSYITQSFADAYQFMNELRGVFHFLINNMMSYYGTLINELTIESLINLYSELASQLYYIMIFNFLYTHILLVSNPSFLTTILNLPPNAAIPDVILGYSIIIYCALNLIQTILKIFPEETKSYILHTLFIINAICGSIIIVGIIFLNRVIVAIPVLIIILSFVYVGLSLKIK
ncbi:MAG: hypothetical protein ACFFDN_14310 [Candidatus Hodarchaeota archaeon]